jgi:hypothetical protein
MGRTERPPHRQDAVAGRQWTPEKELFRGVWQGGLGLRNCPPQAAGNGRCVGRDGAPPNGSAGHGTGPCEAQMRSTNGRATLRGRKRRVESTEASGGGIEERVRTTPSRIMDVTARRGWPRSGGRRSCDAAAQMAQGQGCVGARDGVRGRQKDVADRHGSRKLRSLSGVPPRVRKDVD